MPEILENLVQNLFQNLLAEFLPAPVGVFPGEGHVYSLNAIILQLLSDVEDSYFRYLVSTDGASSSRAFDHASALLADAQVQTGQHCRCPRFLKANNTRLSMARLVMLRLLCRCDSNTKP